MLEECGPISFVVIEVSAERAWRTFSRQVKVSVHWASRHTTDGRNFLWGKWRAPGIVAQDPMANKKKKRRLLRDP